MTPCEELIEKIKAIHQEKWLSAGAADDILNAILDAALAECRKPVDQPPSWYDRKRPPPEQTRHPTVAEIIARLEKLKEGNR